MTKANKAALREDEVTLLREVLQKRAPNLAEEVIQKIHAGTISKSERREVCSMIGIEFMDTGVGADSAPTSRGIALERLLDVLNRPNLGLAE
jgi:hypothetical protein